VREVAERLRVCTSTVYKLCAMGKLRHVRVSNAIRIPETAVADHGLHTAVTRSPSREILRRPKDFEAIAELEAIVDQRAGPK
jgi:excisionase family DNA binding protein